MKALAKELETYRDEIRHYDYRLREILKTLKRVKKESGEQRPNRSLESIRRSLGIIKARLQDIKTPKIPSNLSEARKAELERLFESALHYQKSKTHHLTLITQIIKEKK
jgi:hypothetical protein